MDSLCRLSEQLYLEPVWSEDWTSSITVARERQSFPGEVAQTSVCGVPRMSPGLKSADPATGKVSAEGAAWEY